MADNEAPKFQSVDERVTGRAEIADKMISDWIARQFQEWYAEHREAVGAGVPIHARELVEPILRGTFTAMLRFAWASSPEEATVERLTDNLTEVARTYLTTLAAFDRPGAIFRDMTRRLVN